jgi:hypothetical protein
MISIFIMYSTDRAAALAHAIACLRDMPMYAGCQRTLVVDGKIDAAPADWQAVQVPRVKGKFCWGRMWDAGVGTARHEKIVYLDSDRLLPPEFLTRVADVADDTFAYTSRHFAMGSVPPLDVCKRLLAVRDFTDLIRHPEFVGRFGYEVRHGEPLHGPGKNVMSGSVAFTKRTYQRLGGVDHWYCGHGAYADSDFHMQAAVAGCRFVDLDLTEFHYPHDKAAADGSPLNREALQILGLDNFIYYCRKWGVPRAMAETLAAKCGIKRPAAYVDKRLAELAR